MKALIMHKCSLLTTGNVWANNEIYRDTFREVMHCDHQKLLS
jgi:hypothetical protein